MPRRYAYAHRAARERAASRVNRRAAVAMLARVFRTPAAVLALIERDARQRAGSVEVPVGRDYLTVTATSQE